MEEYRVIEGYENYEVSNMGNVRNCKTGCDRKPYIRNDYLSVNLCKNGMRKSFSIHRLVAIAFIDNPEDKTCVDHIDSNRSNNNVNNLRWATLSENQMNKKKGNSSSTFKGVYFNKVAQKYVCKIKIKGTQYYLGLYNNEEESAYIYNYFAIKHFGEYANTTTTPNLFMPKRLMNKITLLENKYDI